MNPDKIVLEREVYKKNIIVGITGDDSIRYFGKKYPMSKFDVHTSLGNNGELIVSGHILETIDPRSEYYMGVLHCTIHEDTIISEVLRNQIADIVEIDGMSNLSLDKDKITFTIQGVRPCDLIERLVHGTFFNKGV